MRLIVNGNAYDLAVAGHEMLLGVLRGRLALTGTKLVCGRGECGACTVLLDGKPAYACLTLAAGCEGTAITTIEGMSASAPAPDQLHALQQAFIAHDALQCGFCTPGQIMAAAALLAENPHPTEEDVRHGMSGNLCRCGAYPKIVRAVLDAARRLADARGA
ncbi:MAG: (2Fe-2S)-binding protein [Gemmatimonadaceae bacterium]|nr:(2Fe-2S)-binding protein [Gemmatimonadaceae bacterium]